MTAARLEQMSMNDGFGRLIDLARAEPVAMAKLGQTVVVVMAIEEFERLKALKERGQSPRMKGKA